MKKTINTSDCAVHLGVEGTIKQLWRKPDVITM